MKKLTSKRIYNIINYILPCVFIISIVECYWGLWRLATVFKLIAIVLSFVLCARGDYKRKNTIFTALFVLSIASLFSYLYNDRPFECAHNDLFNTVPAMLFFLIALNEKDCNRHFYDYYMYVSSAIYLLGIFCYILTPGWYVNSLAEARSASLLNRGVEVGFDGDTVLDSLRFSAFFIFSHVWSHHSRKVAFHAGHQAARTTWTDSRLARLTTFAVWIPKKISMISVDFTLAAIFRSP